MGTRIGGERAGIDDDLSCSGEIAESGWLVHVSSPVAEGVSGASSMGATSSCLSGIRSGVLAIESESGDWAVRWKTGMGCKVGIACARIASRDTNGIARGLSMDGFFTVIIPELALPAGVDFGGRANDNNNSASSGSTGRLDCRRVVRTSGSGVFCGHGFGCSLAKSSARYDSSSSDGSNPVSWRNDAINRLVLSYAPSASILRSSCTSISISLRISFHSISESVVHSSSKLVFDPSDESGLSSMYTIGGVSVA